MIGALLLVMTIAPAIAAIGCIMIRAPRIAEMLNLAAGVVVFVVAIPLAVTSAGGPYYYLGRYVVVDITGAWVILCTAVVYLLASIYSIGHMRLLGEDERLWAFYALFSSFALTILVSSVMNNAGIYWIAIELTTLVSTFLVGFERAAESIEAAWK
jgi:hydrogenase-4 component F